MSEQQPRNLNNPYLTVVAKKSRNLHKKLDKIMKAEAQQQAGKVLNEEQLVLLATKGSVQKQLADVDAMKTAMEEVAAAESQSAASTSTSEDKQGDKEETAEELSACKAELEQLRQQLSDEVSSRLSAERAAEELQSALQDKAAAAQSSSVLPPDFQATLQQKIQKLLKLFHVCARYPGSKLPADVNYFGKSLMGETSISGFVETLQESTRKAELYLDDELSGQFEVSRGMTYADISVLMDSLVEELTAPPQQPSSPMLNFFTDSDDVIDPLPSPSDLMVSLSSASEGHMTQSHNLIIEDHIDSIIEEVKTTLVTEDPASVSGEQQAGEKAGKEKDKRKARNPRKKKESSTTPATSSTESATSTTAAGTSSNTTAAGAKKPAWGGNTSNAHKAASSSDTAKPTPPPSGATKTGRNTTKGGEFKSGGGRGGGNGRPHGSSGGRGDRGGKGGKGGSTVNAKNRPPPAAAATAAK